MPASALRFLPDPAPAVVDLGIGTGALSAACLERCWPEIEADLPLPDVVAGQVGIEIADDCREVATTVDIQTVDVPVVPCAVVRRRADFERQ